MKISITRLLAVFFLSLMTLALPAQAQLVVGRDYVAIEPVQLTDNPAKIEVIESAARELAPHMIAFYLKDLAADFHSYYNAERMLVDDVELKNVRVAMAAAVRQVIRNGLAILGVSSPQSM